MEKKTVVECEVDSNLEANSDLALDMKSDSTSETGSEECPEVDNAVNANVPSRTVHTRKSERGNTSLGRFENFFHYNETLFNNTK